MLEYYKTILKKVSFDDSLFNKELSKALTRLNAREAKQLKVWCAERFEVNVPLAS